jgi:hypothetical protein
VRAGSGFELADAAAVQQLYAGAQDALAAAVTDGMAPASTNATAVIAAVSETVVLVNSLLEQAVVTAQDSGLQEADKMVQVLARLAKICQVGPAAAWHAHR